MFLSIDPATGREITRHAPPSDDTVDKALDAATRAAVAWRDTSLRRRGDLLVEVARRLRDDPQRWVTIMTAEVGKPVRQARGEVAKSAWCAEHMARHAARDLAPEILPSDASDSRVVYRPLGPLLGILPWNSPFWLAFRFCAPALMAGNPCLIKPDPHAIGCGQALQALFDEAGAPEGLVQVLPLTVPQIERVIADPRIRGVSFTGSTRAGRQVAARAGEAIKPVVLELGGSDPAIVLPDADLPACVDALVLSRTVMAGQSCIAAKRWIVHDAIHDDFVALAHDRLGALVVGDPAEEATDIGPLAREDLRVELHRQVTDTLDQGATCLLGGTIPDGPGWFYPPTLLTEVRPGMTTCTQEVFGPVASVLRVNDVEDAMRVAHDTRYGLAGSLWTADIDQALALAGRLDVGQVVINGLVKTDPRLPSGGVRDSGIGRELGPHGIRAFTNAQQVWVGPTRPT